MNQQFVTYEIASKLKELGFDEECFGFFESKTSIIYPFLNKNKGGAVSSPLWQQAVCWLREKHKIDIWIIPLGGYYKWYLFFDHRTIDNSIFNSYEEAREQAILKAIEIYKKKNS